MTKTTDAHRMLPVCRPRDETAPGREEERHAEMQAVAYRETSTNRAVCYRTRSRGPSKRPKTWKWEIEEWHLTAISRASVHLLHTDRPIDPPPSGPRPGLSASKTSCPILGFFRRVRERAPIEPSGPVKLSDIPDSLTVPTAAIVLNLHTKPLVMETICCVRRLPAMRQSAMPIV